MKIIWQSSYETGNSDIDNQHIELFEKGNKFFIAIEKKAGQEEYIRLLNFLVQYVKDHFTSEEDFMRKARYPLASTHKEGHIKLVKDLADIYTRLIKNGFYPALEHEVMEFMQHWFVNHINVYDKKLADFLKKKP